MVGRQNGYHTVKEFFQSRCGNSRNKSSDKVRAYRATYFGWLFAVLLLIRVGGFFFVTTIACAVSYISAVKAQKPHKRLGVKDN